MGSAPEDTAPRDRVTELETENAKLRAALAAAGLDVSKSQTATAAAEDATRLARTAAATAAAGHARDMAAGRAELADASALNARLQALNDALRASEERLDAVIESATDHAIIEMDFDGRITGWSAGAQRLLGWTAAEAIGQDGATVWTLEDRAAGLPARERQIADATGSAAGDRWHLRRDGTRFWGSGHLTPLRNGRPRGYLKVLRDRTAERHAEETLRGSAARQTLLLALGDAMRDQHAANATLEVAARLLGEHLHASRIMFAEFNEARGIADVFHGWFADGAKPFPSTMSLADYDGPILQDLRAGRTVRIDSAGEVPFDRPDLEAIAQLGVKALLSVPLIVGGRLVANLSVHQHAARRWTDDEVQLVEGVAERLWADIVRARAEERLRNSEERYRSLFETMGQGYCELELVRDVDGRAIDQLYLELNPAFERLFGIPVAEAKGRRASEVFPELEPSWHEAFDRVARTGMPERIEQQVGLLGRWFEVFAYSRGGDRVTVLYEDVTTRKRAEIAAQEDQERQAFLLRFSDALRSESEADAVANSAIRMLVEEMRLDLCYVGVYRMTDNRADLTHQVGTGRIPPMPDSIRLSDFPDALRLAAEGTLVIDDVAEAEDLSEADRRNISGLGLRALVAATLRGGESNPLWAIVAVSARARRWTRSEIALLEEATERTWTAIERARAEVTLRESEARFRTLAGAIEDVFYITDLDRSALLYVSPAYERVWGRSTNELMTGASRFSEALHPDDMPARQEFRAARARGEPASVEYRILRPDGEVRWILDRSFPVRGVEGRLVAGIATDVTERRRAEAALRESEARFRGFADNSADVLWIISGDGTRVEYLSPSFETVFGEPRERITADLGRFLELVHPEDREKVVGFLPRAMAGQTAIAHYRIVRPSDGVVTHLRDTGFPIRDEAGAVARVAGIVQNVNDIVRATAALAAEGERFRTLAEGIPQLVWRSAAGGQWTWSSPQWTAFTGQPEAASVGLGWLDAVHPDDHADAMAAWNRAGEDGVFEADYRLRQVAGSDWRWFQTRGQPVRSAGEGPAIEWLGTSTDIEDQMRARGVLARMAEELEARVRERTAELMAAEESLRQSQKLEAIGQLTGGIAHDFNNMLQGVVGGLDMARRRMAEGRGEDATRYMTAARDAAGRAAGLTRRLLAFARRQRLDPRPVDADALVSGMAELIRRTIGPAISLDLALCDGKWPVLCDPSELEGALLNLCINARDAMPEGGRLTIVTDEVQLSAAELRRVDDPSPGDYVRIRIEDTGTGIPPEILDRVLEPFFTTKPLGQGTGLGLSQVYGFARQSGGLLRIESTPGRGTAVHILLPRGEPDLARMEETEGATGEADNVAGGTVLIVDDEAAVRVPAVERLRDLGYRVVEAPDGPAALRLLDEGLRPDLLVTDVGLPNGMDGRLVAEAARGRLPGLPVLFMTGYARVVLPDDAEVITKPFDLEALAAGIRAALSPR